MLEKIVSNENLLAIIIYRDYSCSGTQFLTPDSAPMQVGVICHSAGYEIKPHLHVPFERHFQDTQEVLFIRKGKIQVDFYEGNKKFFVSRIIGAGDVILMVSGGHGLTVIEDIEMVEAKTGPFMGGSDKMQLKPDTL